MPPPPPQFIYCRGPSEGKNGDGRADGRVTNVHFSDAELIGPIPPELLLLTELRELDLDGSFFSGPIPEFVGTGWPSLAELDLSFNALTGGIPSSLGESDASHRIQELELHHNELSGPLPPAIGLMPRLRELELGANAFTGSVPREWVALGDTLSAFEIHDNIIFGPLYPLASARSLMRTAVHFNEGLCGAVPGPVRWAEGFNPAGTGLGTPCAGEDLWWLPRGKSGVGSEALVFGAKVEGGK